MREGRRQSQKAAEVLAVGGYPTTPPSVRPPSAIALTCSHLRNPSWSCMRSLGRHWRRRWEVDARAVCV